MYSGLPVLMGKWHEEWGCVIAVNVLVRVMGILVQFWAANFFRQIGYLCSVFFFFAWTKT